MKDRWLAPPSVVRWGRVVAAGLLVVGLLRVGTPVGALDALPERAAVADLAVVPPDALGFVHLRVAALRQSDLGKAAAQVAPPELLDELRKLEQNLGVAAADLDRLTAVLVPGPLFAGGFPHLVVAVATVRPYDRPQLLARLLGRPLEETYRGKVVYAADNGSGRAVYPVNERLFLVTEQGEALRPLLRHLARPRGDGPLSPALKRAAGPALLVAGLAPAALEASMFGSGRLSPDLPGGWLLLSRLQGAESATFTADAPNDKLRLALELNYGDELLSRRAQPAWRLVLSMLQDAAADLADSTAGDSGPAALTGLWDHVETILDGARLERKGPSLHLGLAVDASAQMRAKLPQLALRLKVAQERGRSVNNLKQIGLALHNYHDTFGSFPTNLVDPQGKPLLSWRVVILPFLEQEKLYREFRLTEPWDSEHNKKLLAKLPKVYAAANPAKETSGTFYQGFTGPGTVFGGQRGTRIADIQDGTSNTILAVEAGEAVPWTKPADLPFTLKQPLPALGGVFKEGFHAVFCDGAVRFLPRNADATLLQSAITMNGGEAYDMDKLTGNRTQPRPGLQPSAVRTFKAGEMKMAPAPIMKK